MVIHYVAALDAPGSEFHTSSTFKCLPMLGRTLDRGMTSNEYEFAVPALGLNMHNPRFRYFGQASKWQCSSRPSVMLLKAWIARNYRTAVTPSHICRHTVWATESRVECIVLDKASNRLTCAEPRKATRRRPIYDMMPDKAREREHMFNEK